MTWNRLGLAICLLVAATSVSGQELSCLNRIEISKPERIIEFDLNRYFTAWVTDSDVISFDRDLKIKRIDTETSNVKWVKDWTIGVRDWSVSRPKQQLAISKRSNGVTVFNCKDGATVFSASNKWLAKKAGGDSFGCSGVLLLPTDGGLMITNLSGRFGPNAFVFSETLDKVEKAIDIDGMTLNMALSTDGKRLVTVTSSLLAVRDISRNVDVYLSDQRPEVATPFLIDSPVFLNAFHDGRDTIVYAKSGGWGNGEIGVYSLAKKESVVFDSLSNWVHMDVDFRTQRIAVSGSSNITVFDFSGKVMASLKNATGQRNKGIEFSPNADKILVYNRDSIWVFRLGVEKSDETMLNPIKARLK